MGAKPKASEEEKSKVCRMYSHGGYTCAELAEIYNVSPVSVHRWLKSGGVNKKAFMEQARGKLHGLYLSGDYTQCEMAEILGVSQKTVSAWLKKYRQDY